MIKRLTIILLIALSTLRSSADEGMWLVNLITHNMAQMETMGIKLTAEDIYSVNHSSLKDAIVMFDDGSCTGELVSPNGLFLTNHHCGVDAIQSQSTATRNYLKDGYWAKNYGEELNIVGKTASILVKVEDVTAKIFELVDEKASSADYFSQIYDAMQKVAEQSKEGSYHTSVVPMFNFNSFYLFVYERYLDVRLVGAPPTSIGNFGGDVDNWHWPRHTGDFSMFRIYTAPDGSPAEYSTKNVPYKSKKFLSISLKGINEGDFAMIMGFPGSTYRYASPYEATHVRDIVAPWKEKVWGDFIKIVKEAQNSDPQLKVDYTDKHDYLVNFYQKDTWQAESMFRYDVVERLKTREDSLRSWVSRMPSQRTKYLNAIPQLENYYSTFKENKWEEVSSSLSALMYYPIDVNKNINACGPLFDAMMNNGKVKKQARIIRKNLPEIFKNYHFVPDVWLYSTALQSLLQNTSDCPNIPLIQALKEQPQVDVMMPMYAQSFYQRSYFTSPENLKKFLKKPVVDSLFKDPVFVLAQSYNMLYDSLSRNIKPLQSDYDRAMQLYTKGLLEMESNITHYPDANSTLRLTYGKVTGYKPSDGIVYKPFTTLSGLMEKENPAQDVFIVPSKLKQLWLSKDFGIYGKGDDMPVCFLTNNDITGGNSGSPTLDANGNLIGIAFDGNHEAMACDYAFEPSTQRTIIVDIRYVLFVIDKFAGAKNLVDEMTLVKN